VSAGLTAKKCGSKGGVQRTGT